MLKTVVTAGSFLCYQGTFVFQFGPDRSGERLGVVRVGGHVEPGETPWACACREACEEASVRIRHVQPPATFRYSPDRETLEPVTWASPEPAPLLVVVGPDQAPPSLLYLAETDDLPQPATEARALMLLTPAQVAWLAKARVTLGDLLTREGRVVMREPLPPEMALAPGYHLRVLARIMEQYPNVSLKLCSGL